MLAATAVTSGCSVIEARSALRDDCTGRDRRLAATLDTLAALDLHPPGATLVTDGASHGCTDSTFVPYASRWYHTTSPLAEVTAYYRHALPAAGWTLVHKGDIHPDTRAFRGERMCYSWPVDGVTAYLSVGFPTEDGEGPADVLGPGPRDVDVLVSADPDTADDDYGRC
ncbi:hypothetical protein [Parafrankia sp. FMc2]|uniref:hypothetical protein n=1 Tax=Parafrankia sp. FMc2 TaxID=3233196 RepID=UPI0034D56831